MNALPGNTVTLNFINAQPSTECAVLTGIVLIGNPVMWALIYAKQMLVIAPLQKIAQQMKFVIQDLIYASNLKIANEPKPVASAAGDINFIYKIDRYEISRFHNEGNFQNF